MSGKLNEVLLRSFLLFLYNSVGAWNIKVAASSVAHRTIFQTIHEALLKGALLGDWLRIGSKSEATL